MEVSSKVSETTEERGFILPAWGVQDKLDREGDPRRVSRSLSRDGKSKELPIISGMVLSGKISEPIF